MFSRRVMGVGLPLVAHLTPAELAAVIAHEFGHYVSGDVAMGPWVHRTRAAIGRAVIATTDTWLAAPFRAYAQLFLKSTLAVSRQQEFVADRTAARIAGSSAAASALDRVRSLAPAYAHFLNTEVGPVVSRGFLPPMAAGFAQYLEQPAIARFMEAAAESRGGEAHGAYDTHPPMAERIAALRRLTASAPELATSSHAPALERPEQHARALVGHALGEEAMLKLKPIAWDEVAERVFVQNWHEVARVQAAWLGTRTVDDLPSDRAT
jgi:Zn-dependent protease with chaperone function